MVAINELVTLLEVLRAHGVASFETPELKLMLGDLPNIEAEAAPRARVEADPRVEAALRRLPPSYRDPRLWKLGDQA